MVLEQQEQQQSVDTDLHAGGGGPHVFRKKRSGSVTKQHLLSIHQHQNRRGHVREEEEEDLDGVKQNAHSRPKPYARPHSPAPNHFHHPANHQQQQIFDHNFDLQNVCFVEDGYKKIKGSDLKEALQMDATRLLIIDCRQEEDFRKGRIATAINVPIASIMRLAGITNLNHNNNNNLSGATETITPDLIEKKYLTAYDDRIFFRQREFCDVILYDNEIYHHHNQHRHHVVEDSIDGIVESQDLGGQMDTTTDFYRFNINTNGDCNIEVEDDEDGISGRGRRRQSGDGYEDDYDQDGAAGSDSPSCRNIVNNSFVESTLPETMSMVRQSEVGVAKKLYDLLLNERISRNVFILKGGFGDFASTYQELLDTNSRQQQDQQLQQQQQQHSGLESGLSSSPPTTITTTATEYIPSVAERLNIAHARLFNSLTLKLQCEMPSEILPFMYLGSAQNAYNIKQMKDLSIRYILNTAKICQCHFPGEFEYLKFSLTDVEEEDVSSYFDQAYEFIEKARASYPQGKILIHCFMGISRSATFCIAYLMRHNRWPLKKAYSYVREKRQIIEPNMGFMRQLMQYELQLFGSSSLPKFFLANKSSSSPTTNGSNSNVSSSATTTTSSTTTTTTTTTSSGAGGNNGSNTSQQQQ